MTKTIRAMKGSAMKPPETRPIRGRTLRLETPPANSVSNQQKWDTKRPERSGI